MTRTLLLVLAGGLAFVAAAVALMPARAFHTLVLEPRGIEAAHVTGTIWEGRWQGLAASGIRIEQAQIRLRPLSLLRGALAFDFDLSGSSVVATGRVSLSGGEVAIIDTRARILPAALARADGVALEALREPVQLTNVRGTFNGLGCQTLAGDTRSAGLFALGDALSVQLPILEGQLECAGNAPGLRFGGDSPDLGMDGHARLTREGVGWMLRARPNNTNVERALRSLGFTGSNDELLLDGQTPWSGQRQPPSR